MVIWNFWKPFKRIWETISPILSLWTVWIYLQQRGTLPQGKVPPPPPHPLNPHVCFHFYVMIRGARRAWLFEVSKSSSRGYWKQFLLSHLYEHSQNLHAAEGTLYPGVKCSPTLNPHVCFHFYIMIKGLRRALLFEVSESSSRGYWKQFLLSCPYEHRMQERGHSTLGLSVHTHTHNLQPSCMLLFLFYDKGIEKSLVMWSFWKPFKKILETISLISSLWTQSEFINS